MDIPELCQSGLLDMQVCVPKTWSDDEVIAFGEQVFRCGTLGGWQIRREGDRYLNGDPERNQCGEKPEFIHIVLDA